MSTDTDQSVERVAILEGFGATTDSARMNTSSRVDSTNWSVFGQAEYDTLLYASWNRGIKGGNWSVDPLGTVAAIDPANLKHDEEVLYSYEVGAKTDLIPC
jgi:hypothetical protein